MPVFPWKSKAKEDASRPPAETNEGYATSTYGTFGIGDAAYSSYGGSSSGDSFGRSSLPQPPPLPKAASGSRPITRTSLYLPTNGMPVPATSVTGFGTSMSVDGGTTSPTIAQRRDRDRSTMNLSPLALKGGENDDSHGGISSAPDARGAGTPKHVLRSDTSMSSSSGPGEVRALGKHAAPQDITAVEERGAHHVSRLSITMPTSPSTPSAATQSKSFRVGKYTPVSPKGPGSFSHLGPSDVMGDAAEYPQGQTHSNTTLTRLAQFGISGDSAAAAINGHFATMPQLDMHASHDSMAAASNLQRPRSSFQGDFMSSQAAASQPINVVGSPLARAFSHQNNPSGLPPPSPTKLLSRLFSRSSSSRLAQAPHSHDVSGASGAADGSESQPSTPMARRMSTSIEYGGANSQTGSPARPSTQQRATVSPSQLAAAAAKAYVGHNRRFSTGSVAPASGVENGGVGAGHGILDSMADVAGQAYQVGLTDGGGPPSRTLGSSGNLARVSLNSLGSMRLADQYGTLTCIRNSTYASTFAVNFAAESQVDVSHYGGAAYYEAVGPSSGAGYGHEEPVSPGPAYQANSMRRPSDVGPAYAGGRGIAAVGSPSGHMTQTQPGSPIAGDRRSGYSAADLSRHVMSRRASLDESLARRLQVEHLHRQMAADGGSDAAVHSSVAAAAAHQQPVAAAIAAQAGAAAHIFHDAAAAQRQEAVSSAAVSASSDKQQQQQQQQASGAEADHRVASQPQSPSQPQASGGHPVTVPHSMSVPLPVPRFDPAALLGCEIATEHSAALPGYSIGKVIGEGGFCQVRLGVHHMGQRKVAIKIIDKTKLSDPNESKRIQREIRVMKHLSHECIIKLFEVVDSPTKLYLVMEHAPSGSLLDYVRARKRLAEHDAVTILQQIVAGLEYCHRREVVHRDVKLENILLDADNHMKIIDFGLSAFFVPGKRLRVHCGSPSYAAPEIVARKQYEGPPVDVWSLGVVLFAMLAGYLPFHSSSGNKQELCNKIMEGKFHAPDWLSSGAKDVLSRMLTVDPDKRITFEQLWHHPWVKAGPKWEPMGASVYMVRADPSTGAVYADEQLLQELEAAGYPRSAVLQYLLNGDTNYITASYYLLSEGKAELIRKLRGTSAVRRYTTRCAGSGAPLSPTVASSAAALSAGKASGAAAGGTQASTAGAPAGGTQAAGQGHGAVTSGSGRKDDSAIAFHTNGTKTIAVS